MVSRYHKIEKYLVYTSATGVVGSRVCGSVCGSVCVSVRSTRDTDRGMETVDPGAGSVAAHLVARRRHHPRAQSPAYRSPLAAAARYLSAPRPLGSPACRYQGYTYGNRGFGATRCKITGPSPTRGCSASPRVMQHYEEGTPRCLTKIDKIKEIHDDKVKYCLPPEWQSNYTHP